jgi:hypothetical protein
MENDALGNLVDEALNIAREREETLEHLRQALLESNMEDVKRYSAKLCGLSESNGRLAA